MSSFFSCLIFLHICAATVFGDPHIYTFDHLDYTFNGLGEYVLLRADSPRVKLDVQVRKSTKKLLKTR
jgi:hypothetical protein